MENILIDENQDFKIDPITLQKMAFVYNSLEKGWSVKKHKN